MKKLRVVDKSEVEAKVEVETKNENTVETKVEDVVETKVEVELKETPPNTNTNNIETAKTVVSLEEKDNNSV